MVHNYTVQKHIFIYNSYIQSDSACVCCRKFQQKFPGVDIPATSTIHHFIDKLKTVSLVLDKKIKRRCHILTEGILDDTSARLEHLPQKSLAKLPQQADVSVSSARTTTKLLKLSLYKIPQVHALQLRDSATRIHFCNWFIQSVNEGTLDPQLLFFTNEIWFHLNGRMNMHDNQYWSSEKP
jgi:hypothetical protein